MLFCYTSRASEASEILSSLNNKNHRYMLLTSERREYQLPKLPKVLDDVKYHLPT